MNNTKVGVDKIIISVKLNSYTVNMKKVKADTKKVYQGKDQPYTVFRDINTNEIYYLNYFKITQKHKKDLLFNHLIFGMIKNEYKEYEPYCRLDITLPRMIHLTNKDNVNESSELKEIFEKVQNILNDYGLDTDVKNATIQEIELNNNVKLKYEFKEYENIFEYIKNIVIPSTVQSELGSSYKNKMYGYSGFKVANGSRSLKFYDKRTSIYKEYGKDIGENILRIEYRLLNHNTVKYYLNIKTVKELLEVDFTDVQNAYIKMFIKDIYNPLLNEFEGQERAIISVINKDKAVDIFKLMNMKPNDILILLSALKKSKRNQKNYSRDSRKIMKYMYDKQLKSSSLDNNMTDIYFNNINKINEIIKSMQLKEIKYKTTKTIEKELNNIYKALD